MSTNPNEVWTSTADGGKYLAVVTRNAGETHAGRLVVTVASTGKVLFNEQVGLSYGAAFGPDVDDVAYWQDLAIAAIDKHIAEGEQT